MQLYYLGGIILPIELTHYLLITKTVVTLVDKSI